MLTLRPAASLFPSLRRWTLSQRHHSSIPSLPDTDWSKLFPRPDHARVTLKNPETAAKVANAFVPAGSKGKVVLEAYPGPGALTRALLSLPKSRIRRLIILEDDPAFLEYLKALEAADSRVKVIPLGGYSWATYRTVIAEGHLDDIPQLKWEEGPHPGLHFICHVPLTVHGDQLLAQFFRCIPERSWMFQYGGVQMSLLINKWLYDRVSGRADSPARCKVGVIAKAVSDFELAIPANDMLPYPEHFFPASYSGPQKSGARTPGTPYVAMNVFPRREPMIDMGSLDHWDYVLRRLFVLKGTALKTSINSLAPGASNLLKVVTSPDLPEEYRINPKKSPRSLNLKEWSTLVKAFQDWPFAPDDLNITDSFYSDGDGERRR